MTLAESNTESIPAKSGDEEQDFKCPSSSHFLLAIGIGTADTRVNVRRAETLKFKVNITLVSKQALTLFVPCLLFSVA